MAQAEAKKIVNDFNDALSKVVDEYRALSVPEKFRINTALDSMYRLDKAKYYALYSAYSSLIGDMPALEDCVNYFFSRGVVNLNSNSYRCLLSMSNSAMFDELYTLLNTLNDIPDEYVELYRVHFNIAVTLLDAEKAKEIHSKIPAEFFTEEDMNLFNGMLSNVKLFDALHGKEQIVVYRDYISEMLKLHRNKIIKAVYKNSGACIVIPLFYADDDKGMLNINVEYVSDDVDKAIELEDYYYSILFKSDLVPREALNTIVYSLTPIVTKQANVISERVVGVDFS
ncbi:hypothetical protein [Enterobacter hormaechei]|uniref:hypothetical protein n=1 Tax=Enterobacter hormaechei TaxID=158836 RepID=UPI00136357C3|nr:hypothetical protein [Enterobacter hormaechei]QHI57264.1 hypothetical protein GTQ93_07500 [Enterobacter hormaechei]